MNSQSDPHAPQRINDLNRTYTDERSFNCRFQKRKRRYCSTPSLCITSRTPQVQKHSRSPPLSPPRSPLLRPIEDMFYDDWEEREMERCCDLWYDAWARGFEFPPPWIKRPPHLRSDYITTSGGSRNFLRDKDCPDDVSIFEDEDPDFDYLHMYEDENDDSGSWKTVSKK